jgi:hypothetical protein
MKIASLQSNYLPWTGVFELINSVDKFIFSDNNQYTKQDWRNRNKIKSNQWLSVPIKKHKLKTNIIDIKICNNINWKRKHYRSIKCNYYNSKYFNEYEYLLDFYKQDWEYLYKLNRYTTKMISNALHIDTEFYYSEDFPKDINLLKDKNEKIIRRVKELGGTHYISGPKAINYIDEDLWKKHNIKLEYIDYKTKNHFTVLDNIFNNGVVIL